MDFSIAEMFFKGYIDREEAINKSNNPGKMAKVLSSKNEFEVVEPTKSN
jgi:hypothetical protein